MNRFVVDEQVIEADYYRAEGGALVFYRARFIDDSIPVTECIGVVPVGEWESVTLNREDATLSVAVRLDFTAE